MNTDHIHYTDSATTFSGPNAVELFRLASLKAALGLEMRTGLRMSRRYTALAAAKHITGLKTNDRAKHLAWCEQRMTELKAALPVVDDRSPPC